MAWRAARSIWLARHRFEAGDLLPPWATDGPMLRFIQGHFAGAVYDDAAGPAPAAAPAAETPRSDVEPFHASQGEWESWWRQHKRGEEEQEARDG